MKPRLAGSVSIEVASPSPATLPTGTSTPAVGEAPGTGGAARARGASAAAAASAAKSGSERARDEGAGARRGAARAASGRMSGALYHRGEEPVDLRVDSRYKRVRNRRACNSAEECHPHTVEVVGSTPTTPTKFSDGKT